MSDDEPVGLPPTMRKNLSEILSHAASQERTVVEFRTQETEAGDTFLAHALDITEHVAEMENKLDEEKPEP
jgi:hypothetical protein